MFRFFLFAATTFLAAAQCPVLHTKTGLRKTVNGGKTVTLTVRVTNRGTTFNDGGFALQLPFNVAYKSVKVSPKLATAPIFEEDNGMVAWAGIPMHAKKTRTFRVKLAFDKCAGDDPVPSKHNKTTKAHRELFGSSIFSTEIGVATFTGPIDDMQCMVSKTVPVNVRRPKTATDCSPPPPAGFLCGLQVGVSNGLDIFGCETDIGSGELGAYSICADRDDFTTTNVFQTCLDYCTANVQNLKAIVFAELVSNCNCYTGASFPDYFEEAPPAFRTYSIGPSNPSLSTLCD